MNMKKIKIYKLFERFWHWSQSGLILFLALTGFEVHNSIHIFGFEKAVQFHRVASYLFLILIVFAIFWHFTTEEWRQYVPTFKNLKAQVRYYLIGMFKSEAHPTHKSRWKKLNPLQILTYLGFKVLIVPVMVVSGLLYMFHKTLNINNVVIIQDISLESVALWHTLGAFVLVTFIIIHVYMTTTGETPTANIKAMVTGYEELPDAPYNNISKTEILKEESIK
ncbi:MAG: cytochrome B [Bacteroidetes bacterium]|nr:cytochrome B [Bacteroidota bacterium]